MYNDNLKTCCTEWSVHYSKTVDLCKIIKQHMRSARISVPGAEQLLSFPFRRATQGVPAGDEEFGGCTGWKGRTKEGGCTSRPSLLLSLNPGSGITAAWWWCSCLKGRCSGVSFLLIMWRWKVMGGQLIAACGGCQNVFCSLYQVPLVINWAFNCTFFL